MADPTLRARLVPLDGAVSNGGGVPGSPAVMLHRGFVRVFGSSVARGILFLGGLIGGAVSLVVSSPVIAVIAAVAVIAAAIIPSVFLSGSDAQVQRVRAASGKLDVSVNKLRSFEQRVEDVELSDLFMDAVLSGRLRVDQLRSEKARAKARALLAKQGLAGSIDGVRAGFDKRAEDAFSYVELLRHLKLEAERAAKEIERQRVLQRRGRKRSRRTITYTDVPRKKSSGRRYLSKDLEDSADSAKFVLDITDRINARIRQIDVAIGIVKDELDKTERLLYLVREEERIMQAFELENDRFSRNVGGVLESSEALVNAARISVDVLGGGRMPRILRHSLLSLPNFSFLGV